MKSINLITVTGPTASGKTSFAAHLANELGAEIISADSRQVYRGMDLGTGKDYDDYVVNGAQVPYHLIDIHDAGYKYNVYEFQQDFFDVFSEIQKRKTIPMLVGGTGMYIEAVTKGYKLVPVPENSQLRTSLKEKSLEELVSILAEKDRALHNTTDTKHRKRTIRAIEIATYYEENDQMDRELPEIKQLLMGVKFDRESRRKRISERLRARLKEGMVEEVETLLKTVPAEDLIFYGLEYKFITLYLTGELTKEEMTKKLEIAIHQFAKRQMTWFRKMEREGTKIHWLDGHLPLQEKLNKARTLLDEHSISFN